MGCPSSFAGPGRAVRSTSTMIFLGTLFIVYLGFSRMQTSDAVLFWTGLAVPSKLLAQARTDHCAVHNASLLPALQLPLAVSTLPVFFVPLGRRPVSVDVAGLYTVGEIEREAITALALSAKLGHAVTAADVRIFVISHEEALQLMAGVLLNEAEKGAPLDALDAFDARALCEGSCLLVELEEDASAAQTSAELPAAPSSSNTPPAAPSSSAVPPVAPSSSYAPPAAPSSSAEPPAAPSSSNAPPAAPSAAPSSSYAPPAAPSSSAEPLAAPSSSYAPPAAPSSSAEPPAAPSSIYAPPAAPSSSAEPPVVLSSTAALPTMIAQTRTCTKSVVVFLTGEIRGDNCSWRLLYDRLVVPNDADVVIDVWSADPEREAMVKEIFRPCLWFSEPSDSAYFDRVRAAEPRFQLIDGYLYMWGPEQGHAFVAQFYRMHHALTLVGETSSLLVRARLDLAFESAFKLPEKITPNVAYLYDHEKQGIYAELPIPHQCNGGIPDWFGFGDFSAMVGFMGVFPDLFQVAAAMQLDPNYRVHWKVKNWASEPPGAFANDAEHFFAWHMRMHNVTCASARGPRRCLIRRKLGTDWDCPCSWI